MKLLERIFFYLLLAAIPIQLGKHFWPQFAFVQGIRVDYLSPTLYFSDIIFIFFFIFSLKNYFFGFLNFLRRPIMVFFIAVLLFPTLFSKEPTASYYGILRIFQLLYFGFYITKLDFEKMKQSIVFVFVLGGLVEVVISFFQFLGQKSIGGIFYFLGERSFGLSTIGIALVEIGERFLLRPYGTFPHPNVLSFYLLMGFALLLNYLNFKKQKYSVFPYMALLILAIGVIISFSRINYLLLSAIVIVWLVRKNRSIGRRDKARYGIFFMLLIFITLSWIIAGMRADLIRDTSYRLELIGIALRIIKDNIFGVGLNNFFYHEVLFQKNVSPIFLQPVHNIFLMFIVQTGIGGMAFLLFWIRKVISYLRYGLGTYLLLALLFAGLFDHYFITLFQGQIMSAFIMGMYFNKSRFISPQKIKLKKTT